VEALHQEAQSRKDAVSALQAMVMQTTKVVIHLLDSSATLGSTDVLSTIVVVEQR
jgi:hypothetical protein